MRVKLFCDSDSDVFEKQINQFLYEYSEIEIIDIKFSCDKYFNALIFYKDIS